MGGRVKTSCGSFEGHNSINNRPEELNKEPGHQDSKTSSTTKQLSGTGIWGQFSRPQASPCLPSLKVGLDCLKSSLQF